MHCEHVIQVPVVIGENTAEVLVVAEIPLSPPALCLDDVHRLIHIDDCTVSCGKVIINGRLEERIVFKTVKERDDKCNVDRVCGDVRHCTVEVPFHLFVEVCGAQDCDHCEVIDAIAAGQFTKLTEPNKDGTFNCLLEKVVIKIRAKVTQIRHIKITGIDVTPPPLSCPPDHHE